MSALSLRRGIAAAATAALLASRGAVAAEDSCANSMTVSYPAPIAAEGWSYRLIANNFTRPRGLQFDNDGGLLVVDARTGIVHLKLKDEGSTCLSVEKRTTLISSNQLNHGIALSENGTILYASSADNVYSWTYDSQAVTISDSNRTIVTNMSDSGHTTRTLMLSNKSPDTLLVSWGSQSNVDAEAEKIETGHSQIRAFDIKALGRGDAYDYVDGKVIGWGLRNSVGVVEHPFTGGIWSVENSVDEMYRKGKDIHQDNPAEELNFHGYLNGSTESQGGNYGYPLCYAIWGTDDFPDLGHLGTGDQFPSADATALSDDDCNTKYVPPRLAFQAHTAPLDIKFNKDASQAYVTFHGSWDRDDPVGYRIASIAFKDGEPIAPHHSTDAAVDVLTNPDLSKCPDSCFRPVGLAWDSKGRLWFSSDSTGEIFVLEQKSTESGSGSGNSTGTGSGSGDSSKGGDDDNGAGSQFVSKSKATAAVTLAALVIGFLLA